MYDLNKKELEEKCRSIGGANMVAYQEGRRVTCAKIDAEKVINLMNEQVDGG
jgi:hypothetical protein